MLGNIHTLTFRLNSLYVAYAPEFDLSAYGACYEEAVNGLDDELRRMNAGIEGRIGNGKETNAVS